MNIILCTFDDLCLHLGENLMTRFNAQGINGRSAASHQGQFLSFPITKLENALREWQNGITEKMAVLFSNFFEKRLDKRDRMVYNIKAGL